MSPRPKLVIAAALGLFLIAGLMLWKSLNSQASEPVAAVASTDGQSQVIAAARDLVPGQVVAADDIVVRRNPESKIAADGLRQTSDVQGHVVRVAIRKGAQVVRSAVSDQVALGLAVRVPVGYRAYALQVAEAAIAGGFLQVGDHVDLYVTLPGGLFGQPQVTGRSPDDQSKSRLLQQGVAVLAVGTKLQTDGGAETAARTVTLALAPDDLARVALAARLGTITFAIRNPVDTAPVADQAATLSTLTGPAEIPSAASPAPRKASGGGIVIYAGAARGLVHVP